MKTLPVLLAAAFASTACVQMPLRSPQSNVYSSPQAQRAQDVLAGTVVSVRTVAVRDTGMRANSTGAMVGGLAGAGAGAAIAGKNKRGAGAVVGGVLGAVGGAALEGKATADPSALEIVVKLDGSNQMRAVTQAAEPGVAFTKGQKVLLIGNSMAGQWRVTTNN